MIKEVIVWDKFKNLISIIDSEKVNFTKFEMLETENFYDLLVATDLGINFKYVLFKEDTAELTDYEDNYQSDYISVAKYTDYDKYKDKKEKFPPEEEE